VFAHAQVAQLRKTIAVGGRRRKRRSGKGAMRKRCEVFIYIHIYIHTHIICSAHPSEVEEV
jgi:hypothetical protein